MPHLKTMCLPCRERVVRAPRQIHVGLHAPISGLFHTVALDFTGPLPTSHEGSKFMLVGIEHATGWPWVEALKTNLSTDVVAFLRKSFIETSTIPANISSDHKTTTLIASRQRRIAIFRSRESRVTKMLTRWKGKKQTHYA